MEGRRAILEKAEWYIRVIIAPTLGNSRSVGRGNVITCGVASHRNLHARHDRQFLAWLERKAALAVRSSTSR